MSVTEKIEYAKSGSTVYAESGSTRRDLDPTAEFVVRAKDIGRALR